MKIALLVGNGFTSNLIQAFKNEPMMKEFYKRLPGMIDKIEEKFNVFRNLDIQKDDLYSVTVALFCGDNLYCGNDVYPSDDGIHIQETIRDEIINKLKILDFRNPEKDL